MRKRIISLLIALSLCVMAFAGCDAVNNDSDGASAYTSKPAAASSEETTEETTTASVLTQASEEATGISGSGITAEDIYSKSKAFYTASGVDDLSPLTTLETGKKAFNYLYGGFSVFIYSKNGYVTSIVSICSDETQLETTLSLGSDGLLAMLTFLAVPIIALEDSLDGSLLTELLGAEQIKSDGKVHRIVDIDDWRFDLVTPNSDDYILIAASYTGSMESRSESGETNTSNKDTPQLSDQTAFDGNNTGSNAESFLTEYAEPSDNSSASSQPPTECQHNFAPATCTAPKTCTICGKTEGKESGHSWIPATCIEPATCSVCEITSGEALGHDVLITKCQKCDYVDFSSIAKSYTDITAYDHQTGEYYDVQNVKISASGIFSFSFKGKDYALIIEQTPEYYQNKDLIIFNCYNMDGIKEPDAVVMVDTDRYIPRLEWRYLDGCYLYIFAGN